MKLLLSNLPSKGNCYSDKVDIELNPLTFNELMKYTQHSFNCSELSGLLWDMDHFIKSIDGWGSLSAFDLTSIVFMRKYISATFNEELKLNVGDSVYKLTVSEITFKELTEDILDIDTVSIDDQLFLFRIPSMKEYYYACKYAESVDSSMDIGLVTLISSLIPLTNLPKDVLNDHSRYVPLVNDSRCGSDKDISNEVIRRFKLVKDKIDKSIQIDAVLIKYLMDRLMDRYNDVTVRSEGGETVVPVNNLTTDIFRFIECNVPSIKTKINYFKKV